MNPASLEHLIALRSADVLRYQQLSANSTYPAQCMGWRDAARRAAAEVALLVSRRSPATVRQMEMQRGLA